jgi:N-methylhydantoinase B
MRDPIEPEIAKNALTSIADEMAVVALKSAFSIILKESGDASSAICDRHGRLVAQTASATLYHLASFRPSLRELIVDFPLETMSPGDVFVFNDQFRGGIHANDILVFTPVFNSGEVVFFTCDLMHVADLGGVSAGGLPSNATEFYHEGLRLPPLRLYQAGQPDDDLVRIIKANSRTPDKVIGDIRAMVAGNHVGARRLGELIEKYGAERLLEICGELIDYTEVLTRQEIAKIPSGFMKALI